MLRRKQHKAQQIVAAAIRSGELQEPSPPVCESCDVETRLTACHDDVDRPLEVRWLCHRCAYWGGRLGEDPSPRTRRAPAPRPRLPRKPSSRAVGRPRRDEQGQFQPNPRLERHDSPRCGAWVPAGSCQNRVVEAGDRCYLHPREL